MIDSGDVYLEGTKVASVADYADMALAVADKGRQARLAEEEEWQPLGVFGLVRAAGEELRSGARLRQDVWADDGCACAARGHPYTQSNNVRAVTHSKPATASPVTAPVSAESGGAASIGVRSTWPAIVWRLASISASVTFNRCSLIAPAL